MDSYDRSKAGSHEHQDRHQRAFLSAINERFLIDPSFSLWDALLSASVVGEHLL